MDLDEIKKFVPDNGERYIFIENGKPVLVLMSFKDYKNQFSNQKEIEFKETPKPSQLKKEESELTVEDLPF